MIHPANLEEAARETGFSIGDVVESVPVDRVEAARGPTVEVLKIIALGFTVGVCQSGAADLTKLGGEAASDGAPPKIELDDRGWEEGDADDGSGLAS